MSHGLDIYSLAVDPVVILVTKAMLLISLYQYRKSYRVHIYQEKRQANSCLAALPLTHSLAMFYVFVEFIYMGQYTWQE